MAQPARVISVEILGQQYPIRSTLEASYVAQLAAYVDEKIRTTADVAPTTDTVRLAVLAALNIADECFHVRADDDDRRTAILERVSRLEALIDEMLGRIEQG
ncbi:MAG TPA: cell division protein ZapA [Vicinamibacterales bacterium]|nr:cell division protein ZapA [Vicinamibacterales bacterium]